MVLVDVPRERRAGREARVRELVARRRRPLQVRAAEARRAGVPDFVHRRGDAAPRGASTYSEVAPHASPQNEALVPPLELRVARRRRVGADGVQAGVPQLLGVAPQRGDDVARQEVVDDRDAAARDAPERVGGHGLERGRRGDECARERGVQPHLCNVQTSPCWRVDQRDGLHARRCAPSGGLAVRSRSSVLLMCVLFDARAPPS